MLREVRLLMMLTHSHYIMCLDTVVTMLEATYIL